MTRPALRLASACSSHERSGAARDEACDASEHSEDDLVVLVHGTFAGHDDDAGHRWWQEGSEAWSELQQRLPAGARLPRAGEVFHWTGDNSERARIKAGRDLLDRMLQLESAGRGYHLIGHSHGGSVIWHALRLATLRGAELSRLRTWATVGTPFLHYRTRGAWSPSNLINLALALVFLKPAYTVFVRFFGFVLAALLGFNSPLLLHHDEEVGVIMSVFRAPLIKLVEWAGVPVTSVEAGLRVGSYDPTGDQTLLQYLFTSREGWVITTVVLCGGYCMLLLASLLLNPVIESLRIRAEKRLERDAMRTYGGRWLGLWSTSDEAINGLRATLELSISFVNQITPRERILLSDHLSILAEPYRWLVSPLFNHVIRPWLDGIVRSLVVKTAQGNNRPAAEVTGVSPYPVDDVAGATHPSLPETLDAQLVAAANEHARDVAPQLRAVLAQPSFIAGLERLGHALSGRELIHTSYFEHGAILDLLALHVRWGRRPSTSLVVRSADEVDLAKWLVGFKSSLQVDVSWTIALRRLQPAAPDVEHAVRPRRRAA